MLIVLSVLLLSLPVLLLATVGGAGGGSGRSGAAALPPSWHQLDLEAAATCPGLPWTVLAALGTVESMNGQSTLAGVSSGANSAGAEGSFQFEPSTFAAVAVVGPGGAVPPSPYDPIDAAFSAAHLLCLDGGGRPGGLPGAVWSYNHDPHYVDEVAVLEVAFGADPTITQSTARVLGFAAQQLGVPYRWGGDGAGGFDCSGLVRAAEAQAGVALPRTAQEQFAAGPLLPRGAPVLPGDLLFFGDSPDAVTHVGIALGDGRMLDAPHAGAMVRVESAAWGDPVGASRPT